MYKEVALKLAGGDTVAIFQGKSEAGPRALGNRSLLYDPRDPNAKEWINTIKQREWYRPFAATIMAEHVEDWFHIDDSPFMMYAVPVKEEKAALIPGVIHRDNTCRIQTLTREQNPRYYELIEAFYELTGIPLLFNTSLNLGGEVMVETREEAIDLVKRSNINHLYLPEEATVCTY